MKRCLPLVLLAAATVFIALPALLPGRVFFPFHTSQLEPWRSDLPAAEVRALDARAVGGVGDKVFQHHIVNAAAKRALDAGQFPWWSPGMNGGLPLLGSALAGILYPLNWPFFLIDPLLWYGPHLVLHLLIAGLWLYALARSLGLVPAAALLGAVVFALSGWMAARSHYHMMLAAAAWTPGILFGLHAMVRGACARGFAIFALCLALSLLAGFPGVTLIALHLAALTAFALLAGLWRRAGWRRAARRSLMILAALLLGLLIALPQILSSLQFKAGWARRSPTLAELEGQTLRGPHLLTLLWPTIFDEVESFAYAPSLGERPPVSFTRTLYLGAPSAASSRSDNLVETSAYLGFVPLILIASVLLLGTSPAGLLYLLLGGFCLLVAYGSPLVMETLFRWLPGHDLGAPSRYLLGFTLGASVVAAVQFDRLLRSPSRLPAAGATALLLAGVLVTLASLGWEHRDSATLGRKLFRSDLHEVAMESGGPTAVQGLDATLRARDYSWNFERALLATRRAGMLIALSGALALLCLRLRTGWVLLLPALLAGGDLGGFFRRWIPPVERCGLYASHPVLEALKRRCARQAPLPPRLARAALEESAPALARLRGVPAGRPLSPGRADMLFAPNLLLPQHIDDLQGYSLPYERYEELLGQIEIRSRRFGSGVNAPRARSSLASPIVDLMGVRFLIAPHALEPAEIEEMAGFGFAVLGPDDDPAFARSDLCVLENREAFPRLFFAPHAHRPPSAERTLELLRDPRFDAAHCVLLPPAGSGGGPEPAPPAVGAALMRPPGASSDPPLEPAVVVTRYTPQEVCVQIALTPSQASGYLVFSDAWAPGWEAWVDGVPSAVLRADHALRAVVLRGAGEHRVRFKYREPLVKWLLPCAALFALVALAILLGFPRRLIARFFGKGEAAR